MSLLPNQHTRPSTVGVPTVKQKKAKEDCAPSWCKPLNRRSVQILAELDWQSSYQGKAAKQSQAAYTYVASVSNKRWL